MKPSKMTPTVIAYLVLQIDEREHEDGDALAGTFLADLYPSEQAATS